MQYLVTMKAVASAVTGSPEQIISVAQNTILPSFKMLVDDERNKRMVGGAIPGQRTLIIMADFPNHEEANKWVMSLPFFNLQTVEILPLVSFQSQLDSIDKRMQDTKSMLKK